MSDDDKLTFIDPATGQYFKVAPTRATIIAAENLGYIPSNDKDWERADQIAHWEGFE